MTDTSTPSRTREPDYVVKAIRWDGGWELHWRGEAITQCATLDTAEAMVRDYLIQARVKGAGLAVIHVSVEANPVSPSQTLHSRSQTPEKAPVSPSEPAVGTGEPHGRSEPL